jgi:glycosyltransferase involved in cell wall biosynthesis
VKAAVPEARLVFAGDGDVSTLLAQAEALGIRDAIEYLGWIDANSRSRLLASSWVLALPSYQEGLPMAILEAMAFSRAVISCSVGGISQAVEDGRTGFLVRPGDFAALGERLVSILSDRDTAVRLGAAGRLAFESRFSHEATFPRLVKLYREAGVIRTPRLAMGSKRYPLACVDAASRGDGVGSGQRLQ